MRTHAINNQKDTHSLKKFVKKGGKNIKESTNIKLDKELKELFNSMKSLHGLSLGDAAERGVREVLISLNHTGLVQEEINRIDSEVMRSTNRKNKLLNLKEQIRKIRVEPVVNNDNEAEDLAYSWEVWFNEDPNRHIDGIDRGWLNYNKIAERLGFKSPKHAKDWIFNRVQQYKNENNSCNTMPG